MALKKFPPEGCDHYAWLHYVLPLVEQYAAAQREADIQLGEKLAAQMTLKAVCDVLNLPMVSLGNGWTEATPKILARIEEIVDEAERGFRERDGLKEQFGALQRVATCASKFESFFQRSLGSASVHDIQLRNEWQAELRMALNALDDSNPASEPES